MNSYISIETCGMDPIADMLIRIKNAYRARHEAVIIPYSKLKAEIARVLEERNYIGGVEKRGKKVRKYLELILRYPEGQPAIREIRRISKPSRRIYATRRGLKPVRQDTGMAILSTSRGVMPDSEARKLKVGGEVICEVW